MFTGIIGEIGRVVDIVRNRPWNVTIHAPGTTDGLAVGDSVSVSGVCLTVIDILKTDFKVQISMETLKRTILNRMRIGMKINLERALRISDRLDGHIVQGHVDEVGVITGIQGSTEKILTIRPKTRSGAQLVNKGSIAVDGVSLTVSAVHTGNEFNVTLVPLTLARTNLSDRRVGDEVNLEYDIIGKYVARNLGV
ncbi:riboflavin synthase [bacterium]|nr:riboflavin synthase [candidate division CSSED10-310 bacterium]